MRPPRTCKSSERVVVVFVMKAVPSGGIECVGHQLIHDLMVTGVDVHCGLAKSAYK